MTAEELSPRERVRLLHAYASELWRLRLSELKHQRNIPYPPILTYDDYWRIAAADILNRLPRKERKTTSTVLKVLKESLEEVLAEKGREVFLKNPAEASTVLQEEALNRTISTLAMKYGKEYLDSLVRLLVGRPRMWEIVFPITMVTPHPKEDRLRFHSFVHDPGLLGRKDVRESVKRGLADFFSIPHLVHFEPEEVPDLLKDDKVLDILLHPNFDHLSKKVEEKRIPEVVEVLKGFKDPGTVLSRVDILPRNLLHPPVLDVLKGFPPERLERFLGSIETSRVLRNSISKVETNSLRRALEVIREEPTVIRYLSHPLLVEHIDLVTSLMKTNEEALRAIAERPRLLDLHDSRSARNLLEAAIHSKNVRLLLLLLEHPDLSPHYRSLLEASSRIGEEELRELLENKSAWKHLSPRLVKRALELPAGPMLLLSDLSASEKRNLLERPENLTESTILQRELITKHGIDEAMSKILVKYLGRKAREFVKHHGDLTVTLNRRELIPLLLWYRQVDRPLTPEEIRAALKLSRAADRMNPSLITRAVTSLTSEELKVLADMPLPALRAFFSVVLSRPSELPDELRRFIHNRIITTSRLKVNRESPRKDLLSLLEGEVLFYDPKRRLVVVSNELQRRLRLSGKTVKERELVAALLREATRKGADRRTKKDLRADVSSILFAKSAEGWLDSEKMYHPLLEMDKKDMYRLKSFLDSIHRSLKNRDVILEGPTKDGRYVVFRVLRKTHDAKVLFDKDFTSYVNNLADDKYTRHGEKALVPLSFFKVLSSVPELSGHPLVGHLFRLNGTEPSRPSSRSSKGKRYRRRK